MNSKGPLLPRPVMIIIAVVVLLGWLATVAASILNPSSSGPLVTVSGLLAMVIGATFGIAQRARNSGSDSSGKDTTNGEGS